MRHSVRSWLRPTEHAVAAVTSWEAGRVGRLRADLARLLQGLAVPAPAFTCAHLLVPFGTAGVGGAGRSTGGRGEEGPQDGIWGSSVLTRPLGRAALGAAVLVAACAVVPAESRAVLGSRLKEARGGQVASVPLPKLSARLRSPSRCAHISTGGGTLVVPLSAADEAFKVRAGP
jgi:hypothetical protein